MKTVYRVEALPALIPIGIQTEEGVNAIRFDVAAWLDAWPGMTVAAMHTRPGETESYPVVCKLEGTTLSWHVSAVDTELHGQGKIELIGLAPGRRKLSGAAYTHIEETSCSTEGAPPDTIRPFVDAILDAAARAEDAADRAEEASGGGIIAAPAIVRDVSGDTLTVYDAADREALSVVSMITSGPVGSAALSHTGRNLFDANNYQETRCYINGSVLGNTPDRSIQLPIQPGLTYTVSKAVATQMRVGTCAGFPETGVALTSVAQHRTASTGPLTVTAGPDDRWMVIQLLVNADANTGITIASCVPSLMVEIGKEMSGYAPYFGSSLEVDFPTALCGGSYNWVTGVLTVTHGSDGNELPEPVVYLTDPATLTLQAGGNVLWSSTGPTQLLYVADTRSYIDQHSGGSGSGQGGEDGFSPLAFVQETADGAVITITDKQGTTSAAIRHGQDGQDGRTPVKGTDYFDGAKGDPGKDGTSVTVTNVSTSAADGGSNVVTFSDGKTLTVKNGSKGSPGQDGKTPVKGVDYVDGAKGDPGQNGVSPAITTSKSGKVTTVTIKDANGTKTVTINDGEDGGDGSDGVGIKSVAQTTTATTDGGTNVITVTKTDNTTSTFSVKNGSKGSPGADGKTPVKGTDYFTASEKAQMVSDVKASLPTLTLTGVDANGVTHTYTIYGS